MPTQLQVAELGTATVAQLHRLTLNPREVYQAAMVGAAAAAATPAATPTAPHSARSVTPPPPQPPQPSSSRRGATMTETTDVFLAGQTLFYVFSGGYFPFVDVDARDAQACHRAAVASGAEPRWEYLHPLTPPAMVALLAWMLEHDPTKRPPIRCVDRLCSLTRNGAVAIACRLSAHSDSTFPLRTAHPPSRAAWWWSTPRLRRWAS